MEHDWTNPHHDDHGVGAQLTCLQHGHTRATTMLWSSLCSFNFQTVLEQQIDNTQIENNWREKQQQLRTHLQMYSLSFFLIYSPCSQHCSHISALVLYSRSLHGIYVLYNIQPLRLYVSTEEQVLLTMLLTIVKSRRTFSCLFFISYRLESIHVLHRLPCPTITTKIIVDGMWKIRR